MPEPEIPSLLQQLIISQEAACAQNNETARRLAQSAEEMFKSAQEKIASDLKWIRYGKWMTFLAGAVISVLGGLAFFLLPRLASVEVQLQHHKEWAVEMSQLALDVAKAHDLETEKYPAVNDYANPERANRDGS